MAVRRSSLTWVCWLFACSAAIGADTPDPLGYPASVGETVRDTGAVKDAPHPDPAPQVPVARGSDVRRADEPQVPGGLDPWRIPDFATDPGGLLTWFQEPMPASPCDLDLVDPAWTGPGELAYHQSSRRCRCARDHTRAFRSELLA